MVTKLKVDESIVIVKTIEDYVKDKFNLSRFRGKRKNKKICNLLLSYTYDCLSNKEVYDNAELTEQQKLALVEFYSYFNRYADEGYKKEIVEYSLESLGIKTMRKKYMDSQ